MYKIDINIFDSIHIPFFSRKSLICLSFILLFWGVSAQKVDKKWIISAGINAIDLYPTGVNENNPYFPQGEIFEDFFNISDHWNVGGQSISISRLIFRSFYIGVQGSLNNIKKVDGRNNMDYPYYSGSFYIQKRFNSSKKISPFLRLGYGISGIDRGIFGGDGLKFSQYFSESIEPGIGFNFAITKSFGIEISSSFVKTKEETGITHFRHRAGLYIGLGTNDSDGDGIINRKDKCPDVAGLPEFFGCPDTDGDGIIDKEDNCPNKAGTPEFSGCPDTDGDGIIDKEDKCPDEFGPIENNGCKPPIDTPEESNSVSNTISSVSSKTEIIEDDERNRLKEKNSDLKEKINDELVIYFPASKAIILGRKAYDMLLEVRNFLDTNLEKYIVIQGHSSSEGSEQYNYLLSEQRAEAVKTHLINLGIDSNRIKIQAFGSEKPLYEENSVRNIILNRRIEIIFE